ncbi:GAF domain-containing protein [Streptomyces luomodiensis]|uniref:GAF domain-containing protein n=1 Tax=Streptomyces luomodiensis TaxID=3026192 RepID=A0ABY9UZ30_9ACTN|nr:GAF domain-containing protein [Streptomyces sp. SCA4-21]WNE95109.1 GAF domain-containing protein [Streptomyces sp. SCA4-21]
MPDDQPETPYLELLVRGAPAEAYERPVLRARADKAPADRLAALERAKLLALRVRGELEGRRRREAELSALFETAHDLAGLRDLDAVLQAIVQRARSLLGTEVAYLTLNDPTAGDTYMRVTDGSVSARFQQLRLGMGEGLGGLVAQTARPYVTESYFHDPRFQHTGTIDAGVRDEGLVAILGVPLLLGSGVIGVLFAADRRARVFEREQIALLGSFAAHAAVAIDTAHLLAETRTALTELEAANEIIRDRSGVIERASDVHDRLTELVLRGGGVHDVADAVAEVLSGSVEFVEADEAPAAAVDRSRADGRAVRDGEQDWVAAVSAGGELLGALILRGHPRLDPVDQRTLERAAMVTSLLQLARRSAGEAEQRVRGELLDDLLDAPDREPRLLRERAARLRADLDAPHVVLAASIEAPDTGTPAAGPGGSSAGGPGGTPTGGFDGAFRCGPGGAPGGGPGGTAGGRSGGMPRSGFGGASRSGPGGAPGSAPGGGSGGAPGGGSGGAPAGSGGAPRSGFGDAPRSGPGGAPGGGSGGMPRSGSNDAPRNGPGGTHRSGSAGRPGGGSGGAPGGGSGGMPRSGSNDAPRSGPCGAPVGGSGGTPGGAPGGASRSGSGGAAGSGAGGAHAEDAAGRRRLWSAASHLAATRHGLAATRDGGTVLLLPLAEGDTADALARRTARQLGTAVHAPVTVGASAPVAAPAGRPGEVAAGYAEARRCLAALRALGRAGQGAAAEDFGFLGLLLAGTRDGAPDGTGVQDFVTRTLGPVLDYDERRGTELIRTLDAYFAGGMSPARTKDALHVHVNTVAQRLERVGRLLGPDWQSPARSLEIQLALRLHRLASALGY